MTFGTVCSGIEAPSMAWPWEARWFSEIEKFPKAVLKHHYPEVPDLGDFTTERFMDHVRANPVDVFCGGTPCQGFSVAGLRKGLDDDRSNLALQFLRVIEQTHPAWVVWENVPGVFSSNDGRDFGAFLGGLAQLGYGYAYRTLDAQYFGVPQRRRRVFLVACPGDWRRPAAVLFERESLQGDLTPRREKGQRPAPAVTQGPPFSRTGNERVECDAIVALPLAGHPPRQDLDNDTYITHQIEINNQGSGGNVGWADPHSPAFTMQSHGPQAVCMASGQANAEIGVECRTTLNTIQEQPIVFKPKYYERDNPKMEGAPNSEGVRHTLLQGNDMAVAFNWQSGGDCRQNPNSEGTDALSRSQTPAVAFHQNMRDEVRENGVMGPLSTGGGKPGQSYPAIRDGRIVRRLTPRECERLQGFPDDFTKVPYRGKEASECPDGPRYAALGNSIAVPVLKWIGERIEMVESHDQE